MKPFLFIIFLFFFSSLHAQWRLEGKAEDASSGKAIGDASVRCTGPRSVSTVTDSAGRFVVRGLPSGEYKLEIRHLSYRSHRETVRIGRDTSVVVRLRPDGRQLTEVTITRNRRRLQPANIHLSRSDVAERAVMLGEANIYVVLQQQAGVIHTNELNPGLYVRGMSSGHTSIMIDGMNTLAGNHLLGIYPPFNADAFAGMRLLKEDIPVQYGGFSASCLLLETGDAMPDKFAGSVELGILTSKLSLQIPVVRNKVSWTLNARRSYFDLIANTYNHFNRNDPEYSPLPVYGFYDINNALQIRTGARSKFKVAALISGDKFDMHGRMPEMSGEWRNQFVTGTWSWYPTDRFRGQLRAGWNNYRASLVYPDEVEKEIDNRVSEALLQGDMSWEISSVWSINFGGFARGHRLSLETATASDAVAPERNDMDRDMFDWGGYADVAFSPGDIFRIKAGVRADRYRSDIRRLYWSPGASVSAAVAGGTALLSARRQVQFARLYVPLGIQIPVNIWYPSDSLSPPEEAWNFSFSYGRRFGNRWKAGMALYYILLDKQVEFLQGNYFTSLDFTTDIGSGVSKGMELSLSYQSARWQADMQYTLGRSTCRFDRINDGREYSLPYDIRHKLDLTIVWRWHPRWSVSLAQFVQSGFIMTAPTGVYLHQHADMDDVRVQVVPIYTERNNFRMPLSHRLDVSVKHDFKIMSLDCSWTAGLYNAYAYKNPYYVYFERINNEEEKIVDAGVPPSLQVKTKSLLPVVPFISVKANF